jgi:hypothetical protein
LAAEVEVNGAFRDIKQVAAVAIGPTGAVTDQPDPAIVKTSRNRAMTSF